MFQTELLTRESIAAEVRATMARQRMQAKDLAPTIGIANASLSRKLNALAGFTVDELLAIEAALGLAPGDVIVSAARQAAVAS